MYSYIFAHRSSTSDSKKRRDQDIQKISIWPEWTEAELAAEKWVSHVRAPSSLNVYHHFRILLGVKGRIRRLHYLE